MFELRLDASFFSAFCENRLIYCIYKNHAECTHKYIYRIYKAHTRMENYDGYSYFEMEMQMQMAMAMEMR